MNDRERAVCARVKASREDIKWPQSDFARQIGITKDKLASIEYGRTPLRYRTGVDLCMVSDLNAEWLVTGNGQMHGGAPLLWEVEFPFESYGKRLFTEVYDLAPRVFCHTKRVFGLVQEPTPGFDAKAYLSKKVDSWFKMMKFRTPADAERFARAVDDFAEEALQKFLHSGKTSQKRLTQLKAEHEAAITESERAGEQGQQNKYLTETATSAKLFSNVKAQLPSLRERLDRATQETGKMSALADFLGKAIGRNVPLASVSRWLSGKREPGGEITLLLQRWVEKQERQK